MIKGKTIDQWIKTYPLLNQILLTKEIFWTNPKYSSFKNAIKNISLSREDVKDAEDRLIRFAPYIAKVFPETLKSNGIIESPLNYSYIL